MAAIIEEIEKKEPMEIGLPLYLFESSNAGLLLQRL